jgi:hypothetical protein
MANQPDLSREMNKLRNSLRYTQFVVGFLTVVFLTSYVIGRWSKPALVHASQTKVVEANEFLLKDEAGNTIGKLGAQKFGGACLVLDAKENAATAQICAASDGSSELTLSKPSENSSISLTIGNHAAEQGIELGQVSTGLQIWGEHAKHSIGISVSRDGTSLLIRQSDKPAISISTSEE